MFVYLIITLHSTFAEDIALTSSDIKWVLVSEVIQEATVAGVTTSTTVRKEQVPGLTVAWVAALNNPALRAAAGKKFIACKGSRKISFAS